MNRGDRRHQVSDLGIHLALVLEYYASTPILATTSNRRAARGDTQVGEGGDAATGAVGEETALVWVAAGARDHLRQIAHVARLDVEDV